MAILDAGGSVWRNIFTEGTGNGRQVWTSAGGGFSDMAAAGIGGELFFIGKWSFNSDLWWWQQGGSLYSYRQ